MKTSKSAGFSLIELLIAVTILGILIAVLAPNLLQAVNKANNMAAQGYVHHVVKGVEAARDSATSALPLSKSCANLTRVSEDPKNVTNCQYRPDLGSDSFTVTVTSVTGKTFSYDGSQIVQVP